MLESNDVQNRIKSAQKLTLYGVLIPQGCQIPVIKQSQAKKQTSQTILLPTKLKFYLENVLISHKNFFEKFVLLLIDSMEDFLEYNMTALNPFNILVEGTNSLQHLFEDGSSALILMIASN